MIRFPHYIPQTIKVLAIAAGMAGGATVAHAAALHTHATSASAELSGQAREAAFVPIGPAAPAPVVFDAAVRSGAAYDWSPLFGSGSSDDTRSPDLATQAAPSTPGLTAMLAEVNRAENARRFGPDRRRLDCVGYVLAKRDALIRAGLPAEALSPAVVRTRGGVSHAVLIVTTTDGDLVLDNLSPYVESWRRVDYEWIKRQVATRAGAQWAWVGRPPAALMKIAAQR